MEPTVIAYSAIVGMAIVPIYFGSWKSLDRIIPSPNNTKNGKITATLVSRLSSAIDTEVFSSSEAYMFPLTGSASLLSLYLIFRYIGKEYISMLISAYFAVAGLSALSLFLATLVAPIESCFSLSTFELTIKKSSANSTSTPTPPISSSDPSKDLSTSKKSKKDPSVYVSLSFTLLTFGTFVIALALTFLYAITKHWTLNNLLGLSFCMFAIRVIAIDTFKTGFILLAGLFFYDIFWVFGTDVMVSVAVNLDAPIKVLFPRNIFAEKFQFAMLGLGDIVIPGLFIALCLRWDYHRYLESIYLKTSKTKKQNTGGKQKIASSNSAANKNQSVAGSSAISKLSPSSSGLFSLNFPKTYFNVCMVAYLIGLLTTIFVMHVFKAAQPALLYLSPACLLSVLFVALYRGEVSSVYSYCSTVDEKIKKLLVPEEDDVNGILPAPVSSTESSQAANQVLDQKKDVLSQNDDVKSSVPALPVEKQVSAETKDKKSSAKSVLGNSGAPDTKFDKPIAQNHKKAEKTDQNKSEDASTKKTAAINKLPISTVAATTTSNVSAKISSNSSGSPLPNAVSKPNNQKVATAKPAISNDSHSKSIIPKAKDHSSAVENHFSGDFHQFGVSVFAADPMDAPEKIMLQTFKGDAPGAFYNDSVGGEPSDDLQFRLGQSSKLPVAAADAKTRLASQRPKAVGSRPQNNMFEGLMIEKEGDASSSEDSPNSKNDGMVLVVSRKSKRRRTGSKAATSAAST